ncbi:MAG: hypothetical protein AAF570_23915, partial [Bacteroidota bacterium]
MKKLRNVIAMMAVIQVCFALVFAPIYSQSDRPCNSPIITIDECTVSYSTVFANTGFQADAPLPGACSGNYTRDG